SRVLRGGPVALAPAFAVLVVVCKAQPAGRESAHDDRQQGASHDSSSDRTGASDPSGNKDVEGGADCDRLEEHSRQGRALRGGGVERRLPAARAATRWRRILPTRSRPSGGQHRGGGSGILPWGGNFWARFARDGVPR